MRSAGPSWPAAAAHAWKPLRGAGAFTEPAPVKVAPTRRRVWSVSDDSQVLRIVLAGEIDTSSERDLRAAELIRFAGPRVIVLDLGDVTFIDSAGLGLLLKLQRRVAELHRTLTLENVPPLIRSTLSYAGLDTVFTITDRD